MRSGTPARAIQCVGPERLNGNEKDPVNCANAINAPNGLVIATKVHIQQRRYRSMARKDQFVLGGPVGIILGIFFCVGAVILAVTFPTPATIGFSAVMILSGLALLFLCLRKDNDAT